MYSGLYPDSVNGLLLTLNTVQLMTSRMMTAKLMTARTMTARMMTARMMTDSQNGPYKQSDTRE
jgi:hypothetical protein